MNKMDLLNCKALYYYYKEIQLEAWRIPVNK